MLNGTEKKAQAAACTEQAATLAAEPLSCAGGIPAVTGLRECDVYIHLIEKYLVCDKVPQAARDGAKQGIDAMKQGWGDMKDFPEEAKKAAADACRQASDALQQGASAMGCTL